jgi:hypothetical protein
VKIPRKPQDKGPQRAWSPSNREVSGLIPEQGRSGEPAGTRRCLEINFEIYRNGVIRINELILGIVNLGMSARL